MTPETPYLPPVPPAVPPSRPDRSGWLIAFGIFDILLGLFFWMFTALASLVGIAQLKKAAPETQPSLWPVLIMYGGLGTAWILLGIASAMKKNWARISLIVVSAVWLAVGALTTIMFAAFGKTIFQDAAAKTPNADPNMWKFVLVFSVGFSLIFMVALPLVLLVFYTRPSVKATCAAVQSLGTSPSRPLLLNILSGWFFFVAATSFFALSTNRRLPLFA